MPVAGGFIAMVTDLGDGAQFGLFDSGGLEEGGERHRSRN
jgi:hypothetical protein